MSIYVSLGENEGKIDHFYGRLQGEEHKKYFKTLFSLLPVSASKLIDIGVEKLHCERGEVQIF